MQQPNYQRCFIIVGCVFGLAWCGASFYLGNQDRISPNPLNQREWQALDASRYAYQSPAAFIKTEAMLKKRLSSADSASKPIASLLLGHVYALREQWPQAIAQYKAAIRPTTNWWNDAAQVALNDQVYEALALIDYRQQRPQKALQQLSHIKDLQHTKQPTLLLTLFDSLDAPDRADFHLALAQELRRELYLDLAQQEFRKAAQVGQSPQIKLEAAYWLESMMPHTAQKLPPLARYYSLAGKAQADTNPRKAASLYQQAIALAPQFEWAYNDLAVLYRELKQYPAAEASARRAIEINPQFYHPHLTLADIALDQGRYSTAIQQFNAAKGIIAQLPEEARHALLINIENEIGYAFESMRLPIHAAEHYRQALHNASETPDETLATANEHDEDSTLSQDIEYAQESLNRLAAAQRKQDAHETFHHQSPETQTLSSR